jgi:hypothetical protein
MACALLSKPPNTTKARVEMYTFLFMVYLFFLASQVCNDSV